MKRGSWLIRQVAAAAVATSVATTVSAGLLPVSVTVTPEQSNYRWTYAIVLPTDMKLESGNFFTIYDFGGYVPGGESAPQGWTFSASKTGPTPERVNPTDDPEKWNLTWKYSGPTIPSGQIGLGNFWAISTESNAVDASFTARTNRSSDGLIDSNITETQVPDSPDPGVPPVPPPPPPPNVVPEPATLAMAGLGLPLIGFVRAMRRKKA